MAFSRRDALILGGTAAGAVVAGFAGHLLLRRRGPAAALRAAPFIDLSGHPRSLREWRDRIVVCNFWATWCPPCRREIPMLVAMHRQLTRNGVELVGIAVDSGANVAQFARSAGVTYPILVAVGNPLALLRELGDPASALPFTVVLDRRGEIVYRKLGILQRDAFEAELRRLVAA